MYSELPCTLSLFSVLNISVLWQCETRCLPLGVPQLHFGSFITSAIPVILSFFPFFLIEEDTLGENQGLPSMTCSAKYAVKSPEHPPVTLAKSQNTSSWKGFLGTFNKSLLKARLATKLNQAVQSLAHSCFGNLQAKEYHNLSFQNYSLNESTRIIKA